MIHNPGHLHLKRMLSERTIVFTPSNRIFFLPLKSIGVN